MYLLHRSNDLDGNADLCPPSSPAPPWKGRLSSHRGAGGAVGEWRAGALGDEARVWTSGGRFYKGGGGSEAVALRGYFFVCVMPELGTLT